jgi:hypothetical protein
MFLKTMRRAKPRTVNLSLAAIDHFYEFLGLGNIRTLSKAFVAAHSSRTTSS